MSSYQFLELVGITLSSLPSKIFCKVIAKLLSLTVSKVLREKQVGFIGKVEAAQNKSLNSIMNGRDISSREDCTPILWTLTRLLTVSIERIY